MKYGDTSESRSTAISWPFSWSIFACDTDSPSAVVDGGQEWYYRCTLAALVKLCCLGIRLWVAKGIAFLI